MQHHFTKSTMDHPIDVEREFRAAWVASVGNINWPSEPGLSTEQQKQEALTILDDLQKSNFNTVIFQVRPQADALYESKLEPWSYFLTGEQGRAPKPYYDPLTFWIAQAHKRGLELHAWLNPYRAHHIKGGEISTQSIIKTNPNLVVKLNQGYYWLIPTKEATKQYSYNVVMDIVKRYDIDGIHFDDYFYPYPSYNDGDDFPDSNDYSIYQKKGGSLTISDWRREAVNDFIQRVYQGIKSVKKHVMFGISPFGIWKPDSPNSIKGMSQYDTLYADSKLWLNEGWIDYLSPQLYWKISQYPQSFPLLLNWWESENLKHRHLWPGLHTKLGVDKDAILETINSIMISRAMLKNRPGVIFWNAKSLNKNPDFQNQLITGPFKNQAIVPASKWLSNIKPLSPSLNIKVEKKQLIINWRHDHLKSIRHWVIYMRYGKQWSYQILNSTTTKIEISAFKNIKEAKAYGVQAIDDDQSEHQKSLQEIALSAVDRYGNESEWQSIKVEPFSVDQF